MANFLSDLWQQYTGESTAQAALNAQNQQLGNLNVALQPFQAFGPAGTAGYNPATGTVNTALTPQLQQAFGGLTGLANTSIQNAAGQGALPANVLQAAFQNQLQQLSGVTPQFGQFAARQGDINTVNQAALASIFGRPSFQSVADSTLANLRAQAAPQEQQAFNKLGESLFGTGRTGTTGGALQTEAFARGLGQADLQRQLAAQQEARSVQTLSDQLLNSAFGRFAQTQGLASDVQNQLFGQQLQAGQFGRAGTQQNFANAAMLAQLPYQLQAAALQPGLSALTAQGALNQQAFYPFQAALAAGQAQANTALGAGSNIASLFSPQVAAGVEGAKSGATQGLVDTGIDIFKNVAGDYIKDNASTWLSSLFNGGSGGSASGLGLVSSGAASGTGTVGTATGTGANALSGAQGAEAFGAPQGWDTVGEASNEGWLSKFNEGNSITNAVNAFLGGKATEAFIRSGAQNTGGAYGATIGGTVGSLIPLVGPVTGAVGALAGGIIGNIAGSVVEGLTGNADQDWAVRFQTQGDSSNFENGTSFNTALGQFGLSAAQTRNLNNDAVQAQLAPLAGYFKAMDAGIAQNLAPDELQAVKAKLNGFEAGQGANATAQAGYGRDPITAYTKQRLESIKAVLSPERLKETGFDQVIDAYNSKWDGLSADQAGKLNDTLAAFRRAKSIVDTEDSSYWGYYQEQKKMQDAKALLGDLSKQYLRKDITNDQGQDQPWYQNILYKGFSVGQGAQPMYKVA